MHTSGNGSRAVPPLVERLNELLRLTVVDYGPLSPMPEMLRCAGFWPGAVGHYGRDRDGALLGPSEGCIVVLGHNWGTPEIYDRVRRAAERDEDDQADSTKAGLSDLLGRAGIPLHECFLTNSFPGLKADGRMVGRIHGLQPTSPYYRSCVRLFEETVSLLRPRAVITLGEHAAAFVSHGVLPGRLSWTSERGAWRGFAAIDTAGAAAQRSMRVNGHEIDRLVAWSHPSMRSMWARRRFVDAQHCTHVGADAMAAMLRS